MDIEEIRQRSVIAILRGASLQSIIPIVNALQEGGVSAIEITMEAPKALAVLEKITEYFADDVFVGAGTVLDPETARAAILSGARFICSPTVNRKTIEMTKRYGVISVPGAFTPTEILTAYESGGDIVKVFPAAANGPNYIKNISGPLPHIPLMPTGGIDLYNARDFMIAGACAIGIGSTLVNTKKEVNSSFLSQLTENSIQLLQLVKVKDVRKLISKTKH
ncbi:bifunctional 4-hydroxy-2-oxoglutarate aldolase/2-dehydro-3-deoxy-phosphogluconate aldolase [Bacillus sp. 03113]|uniref:bifunctional 4-hydroxy-2-oxoglutarate aldolase/2-dehydro-3-deoxy-phosphogluconate aldolase n=1 Tax=Bacillus sp. 03113 TaxID=2578211 RepID=UPI0011430D73|nr:bifunctional 4-hydroxy-2-oxoglutarate aldolase/2-dehydro-3-deoxy-phosphogluconate aldolase [Bacillus sp. 03113]